MRPSVPFSYLTLPARIERRYEPQLDGLRALAVLAVAWSHWAPRHQFGIPFGFGVHLFFVISGYLITGILLEIRNAADRSHGIGIFYLRRALRIFPAYYATIAVAALAGVPFVRETWPWHVAYLSNVLVFLRSEWLGTISHWWSLSVEEQFYLGWPCLIIFAPWRALRPMIMAAVVIGPVFRGWLATSGHPLEFTMVLMPGALDCLGIGALLALAKRRSGAPGESGPGTDVISAAAIGVTLTVALGHTWIAGAATVQTLAAVCFGWTVWKASSGFGGPLGRALGLAPVRYLGRISYGFYLVHNFAWGIVAALGVNVLALPSAVRLCALFSVTLAVASVSWHVMEKPLNDLKRRLPYASAPDVREPARGGLPATPAG